MTEASWRIELGGGLGIEVEGDPSANIVLTVVRQTIVPPGAVTRHTVTDVSRFIDTLARAKLHSVVRREAESANRDLAIRARLLEFE